MFADAELRAEIENLPVPEKQAVVIKQRDAEANVELDNVVVIEHYRFEKSHGMHLRHDEQ